MLGGNADIRIDGVRVLVMDTDRAHADGLASALGRMGAEVEVASDMAGAEAVCASGTLDALLAHVGMFELGAEKFIRQFKARNPQGMFFLIIDKDTSVSFDDPTGLLVEDYLEKPVDAMHLAYMLTGGTSRELAVVDPIISQSRPYFKFRSDAMRRALENLPRIATSNETVLISGETGTGKEIVSRAVHVLSPRRNGPFVALNCGAIPEGLIEGELFGHEKGAFTGAAAMRKGKFEIAHGGTLLLDEIGDMPLNLQVRLLRVLEENHVVRVGGERPVTVDVRVIGATRRDLWDSVREGTFREDLYYRLSILRVHLPPLRKRVEDISLLAVHFMDRAFMELGMPQPWPKLSSAAIGLLERQPWRGNVRELRNVITRVATLLPRGVAQVLPVHITPHLDMHDYMEEPPPGRETAIPPGASHDGGGVFIPSGATMAEAEEMIIAEALRATGGNRTRAAEMLGIGIRTLRRKLNQ